MASGGREAGELGEALAQYPQPADQVAFARGSFGADAAQPSAEVMGAANQFGREMKDLPDVADARKEGAKDQLLVFDGFGIQALHQVAEGARFFGVRPCRSSGYPLKFGIKRRSKQCDMIVCRGQWAGGGLFMRQDGGGSFAEAYPTRSGSGRSAQDDRVAVFQKSSFLVVVERQRIFAAPG